MLASLVQPIGECDIGYHESKEAGKMVEGDCYEYASANVERPEQKTDYGPEAHMTPLDG